MSLHWNFFGTFKKISSLKNLEENYIIIDDKRIAFNINSKYDYDLLGTA